MCQTIYLYTGYSECTPIFQLINETLQSSVNCVHEAISGFTPACSGKWS